MPWRLVLLLCLLSAARQPRAADSDGITTGIRYGALIGQRRLASAPFVALDKIDRHHIAIQVSYTEGKIQSTPDNKAAGDGYVGKLRSNSVGLAYTSASNGPFSVFGFTTYSNGSADSHELHDQWKIHKSRTEASAFGLGVNFVLIGSAKSAFALGFFTGGLGLMTKSRFHYYNTKDVQNPMSHVRGMNLKYGPAAGLQAKFRPFRFFSLRGYTMYYRDLSNKCLSYSIEGRDSGCVDRLDNSFAALGTSVGVWRFSLGLYSRVWTRVEQSDVRIENWQLSYTYGF